MTNHQFVLFFVIGVVKSADIYEFSNDIRFKSYPSSENEFGNEFQPQDYVLGSWGGNKLKFGGNLDDWSRDLRTALRTDLLNNITANSRFTNVQLITGNNPEDFTDVTTVQQCAELCLFLANLTDFGDLSCGGFQYSLTDSKCWPAQGWVIGKEYNDSCKNNLTHIASEYCCIEDDCCETLDSTAPSLVSCVKEYQPRRTSDPEDFAVYIRMFPPTQAPTISPTQPPTSSPTKTPTLGPTRNPTTPAPTESPTVLPTSSPTVSPSTSSPSHRPTLFPSTSLPTQSPTVSPSTSPTKTRSPTVLPTIRPTAAPTSLPTQLPSQAPTSSPTSSPPTSTPTSTPTHSSSPNPSSSPAAAPTLSPVVASASTGGASAVPVIAAVVAVVVLIVIAVVIFCICRHRGATSQSKQGIKQRTESVNEDIEATNHGFRKFEINNPSYATPSTDTTTDTTDMSDYATVEDMKSTTTTTTTTIPIPPPPPLPSTTTPTTTPPTPAPTTTPTPTTTTTPTPTPTVKRAPQLPKGAPPKARLPPSNTSPTGKPPVAQVVYGLSGATDSDYAYTEPMVDTNATYSTVDKNRGDGDIMYATVDHAATTTTTGHVHSNNNNGKGGAEEEVMYAELQGNPMYTTVEHAASSSSAKKPKLPTKLAVMDATYEDMDTIAGNHTTTDDSVTYADIEPKINKSAVLYADPLDTMGMGYAA